MTTMNDMTALPEALSEQISKMKDSQKAQRRAENNCLKNGQLAFWPEAERRSPNEIMRSSLFSAKSKKALRVQFKDNELFVWGSASLFYTGEELRTYDDELIWLQICHYFRGIDIDNHGYIEFSTAQLLKALKWPKNDDYYKRVDESINRLDCGRIKLRTRRDDKWIQFDTFSLIRKYKKIEKGNQSIWRIYMEPEVLKVYEGSCYTKCPWNIYLKLSPTDKKLLGWILSHKSPSAITTYDLRKLFSSNNDNESSFKQFVNRSLKKLVKHEILTGYEWQSEGVGDKRVNSVRPIRNTEYYIPQ